ncbi:MAG: phospholipase D-like domain-containing protein [Candidatus Thorarchaeota archaeon]|nr:phospholipase D-like domain-containing protein [Candidatus Thorarchaeota archaeon]
MQRVHHQITSLFLIMLMMSGVFTFVLAPASATDLPTQSLEPAAFTWQTFNKNMNVTTFASPDGSRDALWQLLQSARQSIYVEIYGINNPYILDLIHEIHSARPSLVMKFLIGWNSLGYPDPNKYVANNLTQLGFEVKWTNSSDFTYAHQKFFIIDNKTTVVHAGNWAKTSFPETGKKANREWSIAMTDPDVTGYYRSVFDYDWGRGRAYSTSDGTGSPLSYSEASSTYPRPFATPGHFSGPMNVTPIFSPDTSLQGILYVINSARVTLDIQIPYFTNVGDSGEVDQIIDAILAAKARGVTVRVITEEEKDYQEVADLLHAHNIPIVWQDTRWFTANHNKGIIADGRIVLISSINYSEGSITKNREAGVIIENQDVAQWYQAIYDFDWGIGDTDVQDDVNLYWDPNIPKSTSKINITVFAHALNSSPVDDVELDLKIGNGAWSNFSIVNNLTESAESDPENYFYTLDPQPDGTNITVVARIKVGSTWHTGVPMVIRVRDSLGSAITTTTTTTTTTTLTPFQQFMIQYGPIVIAAVVAIVFGGGVIAYKKGVLTFSKKRSRRRRKR